MKNSDIFDRIAASAPANSTAAKVTSRGSHYEPTFIPCRETWDTPPPMRDIPANQQNNPNLVGIMGRKFGRLTVLGLLNDPERSSKQGSSWVVRCACGAYEVRKAKTIRNPLNIEDRCSRCDAVKKHQENYKRLGPRAIEEFTKPEAAE